MLNFGMVSEQIDDSLELYFQQCSILVNAHDLAVMGATLANAGVNPLTKERAIDQQYVKDVLSIMLTCGMYDYAGEWAYRVGLPAKSGVGGGICAVVPGRCGIGIFSPLLDPAATASAASRSAKNSRSASACTPSNSASRASSWTSSFNCGAAADGAEPRNRKSHHQQQRARRLGHHGPSRSRRTPSCRSPSRRRQMPGPKSAAITPIGTMRLRPMARPDRRRPSVPVANGVFIGGSIAIRIEREERLRRMAPAADRIANRARSPWPADRAESAAAACRDSCETDRARRKSHRPERSSGLSGAGAGGAPPMPAKSTSSTPLKNPIPWPISCVAIA